MQLTKSVAGKIKNPCPKIFHKKNPHGLISRIPFWDPRASFEIKPDKEASCNQKKRYE
jgi:hypothetical protein